MRPSRHTHPFMMNRSIDDIGTQWKRTFGKISEVPFLFSRKAQPRAGRFPRNALSARGCALRLNEDGRAARMTQASSRPSSQDAETVARAVHSLHPRRPQATRRRLRARAGDVAAPHARNDGRPAARCGDRRPPRRPADEGRDGRRNCRRGPGDARPHDRLGSGAARRSRHLRHRRRRARDLQHQHRDRIRPRRRRRPGRQAR